ncbi:MAG: BrnT family toxin [Acidobacteriia bacterium]|nr:BrnT family toxin [Terriglobia bacterium]
MRFDLRHSFELARTIFTDQRLLTVPDLEHGATEERWLSIGCASNGVMHSVVYLWSDADTAATKIRLISARKATQTEIGYHQEGV